MTRDGANILPFPKQPVRALEPQPITIGSKVSWPFGRRFVSGLVYDLEDRAGITTLFVLCHDGVHRVLHVPRAA
jgi:hypothetical protein